VALSAVCVVSAISSWDSGLVAAAVTLAAAAAAYGLLFLAGRRLWRTGSTIERGQAPKMSCPPHMSASNNDTCVPVRHLGDQRRVEVRTPGATSFSLSAFSSIGTDSARCSFLRANSIAWPAQEGVCASAL
jgi:hypothetical protein